MAIAACGQPSGGGDAGPDGAVCAPGTTRCSTSGNGTETCGADGQWGAEMPCDAQACVNGLCAGTCAPGDKQCSGEVAQTCDATGIWQTDQTCPIACCSGQCVDPATDPAHCGTCDNACDTGGTCGTSFDAFTGTQSADWVANGNASYDAADQAAQLTDIALTEAGTWIYQHQIFVDSIHVAFDFQAGGGTGADGLGLMFETKAADAVGYSGGGLGMTGLGGFGVELDTFDNTTCLDANANHVAIDSLIACTGTQPTSLVENDAPGLTLADGAWHTTVVDVAAGSFTVTIDGMPEFTSYQPTGWANGKYWFGFAASTGGTTDRHLVKNVHVTFPTPHCY